MTVSPIHHPLATTGRRRGMTLVEVLVASAVLAVVLGLALGMMIESRQITGRLNRRMVALNTGQELIRSIGALVANAAAPGNLDGPAPAPPLFASGQLTVMTYSPALQGYALATVAMQPGGDEATTRVTVQWLGDAPTSATGRNLTRRPDTPGYSMSVEFAYARAAAPGVPPQYQPVWPADQWPGLVRITITARPEQEDRPPLVLQTAVIPGGLASGPPPPPQTIQTPIQSAALQSTSGRSIQ